MQSENYIYFFTICGFFIGLTFSIINFVGPFDILLYTFYITLFFYLFIHVVVINFIDLNKYGKKIFNKEEYEEVSEYLIRELDFRETKMNNLLIDIERVNQDYQLKRQNDDNNRVGNDSVKEAA